jgi:hypothetical protein
VEKQNWPPMNTDEHRYMSLICVHLCSSAANNLFLVFAFLCDLCASVRDRFFFSHRGTEITEKNQDFLSSRFPLRLCAFAGNSFCDLPPSSKALTNKHPRNQVLDPLRASARNNLFVFPQSRKAAKKNSALSAPSALSESFLVFLSAALRLRGEKELEAL